MSEQLSEGGKNLVEDEKMRRKLAIDNEELQAALEEAEGILEQESAKLVKVKKGAFINSFHSFLWYLPSLSSLKYYIIKYHYFKLLSSNIKYNSHRHMISDPTWVRNLQTICRS